MDTKRRELVTKAYDTAAQLILKAADTFTEQFPPSASVNNFYRPGADRKSTRLNSSHSDRSRMPSSA